MKILADMHISPATVTYLQSLGHNVVRINEIMSPESADDVIVEAAAKSDRIILTQDLDFSEIIALSQKEKPSLISLRLSSSRIENVNAVLTKILPQIEDAVKRGAIVSVEDNKIRVRPLPI